MKLIFQKSILTWKTPQIYLFFQRIVDFILNYVKVQKVISSYLSVYKYIVFIDTSVVYKCVRLKNKK